MSSAESESFRLSKTPTTTQALRCFSGLPLFMVNSIAPHAPDVTFACPKADRPALSAKTAQKVKISRRHDLSSQPDSGAHGHGDRALPRTTRDPFHEPRA